MLRINNNAMKKTLLLPFLILLCALGYAQPKISNLTFPKTAQVFGLYELSFQLGSYSNPYDPEDIDVYAEFVGPDGKSFKVNGFYYEGYDFQKQNDYEVASTTRDIGWRVRFTPNQAGNWTFTLHAIDQQGSTTYSIANQEQFAFDCKPANTTQGFIRQANTKYLKREAMENGKLTDRPFYPIGPNVAWYSYKGSNTRPTGIYSYTDFIDKMSGSANFMRIWLTRYQYLSLYGPEYTQKVNNKTTVYFDSTLNQKDAAELDFIIKYAANNGITIMPCIFTYGDFGNMHSSESRWDNNPYNTVLGLKSPTLFFTDKNAKRIAKNLVRYIVARWGYATNIVCWELWNEVTNIGNLDQATHENIVKWHGDMADYIRSNDPFNHLISTSLGTFNEKEYIGRNIYQKLDIVQYHTYGNIQKAKSKEQRTRQLFEKFGTYRPLYPNKPIFCGEFGFGQSSGNPKYQDKDPRGFDTHNCIWASLFSGSMGSASFWFWDYLNVNNLLKIYAPVLTYSKNLPRLSDSFTPRTTASIKKNSLICPNGIETYYLASANEDTLYGWCQDTAFSYQALRRLTDRVGKNGHFDNDGVFDPKGYVYSLNEAKKPKPSSNSNTITLPISNQAAGTQFIVRWYDAETGLEIASEKTTARVEQDRRRNKFVSIAFPSSVRDLKKKKINNTYGDAVFSLTFDRGTKEESDTQGAAPNKTKTIRIKRTSNQ